MLFSIYLQGFGYFDDEDMNIQVLKVLKKGLKKKGGFGY